MYLIQVLIKELEKVRYCRAPGLIEHKLKINSSMNDITSSFHPFLTTLGFITKIRRTPMKIITTIIYSIKSISF